MAQTRIPYDICAYEEKLKQSQEPMYYHLYIGQRDNCNPCVSSTGARNNRVPFSSEIPTAEGGYPVEVESVLSNRGYPLGRCISGYTLVDKEKKLDTILSKNPLLIPKNCSKKLTPEDTRLDLPPSNFREINIDRFEWPIINPYEFTFWAREGAWTRNDIKDAHKLKPTTPITEPNFPVENIAVNKNMPSMTPWWSEDYEDKNFPPKTTTGNKNVPYTNPWWSQDYTDKKVFNIRNSP